MAITVTGGIPTWFIDQFESTLQHVQQQTDCLFGPAVRRTTIIGAEDKAFDIMGSLTLVAKTERNGETPTTDATAQRRWVTASPFHQGILKDRDDDLQMLIDPQGDFVIDLVSAAHRLEDDIIVAAFDADVVSGRRYGDSSIKWAESGGNTKYTTPTSGGRVIAHDCASGNCNASDTGMTVEKVQLVLEYFAVNETKRDEQIFGAISPRQATNLFGQEEYVSIDYNDSKPLVSGYPLKKWMGVNWIISNKIVLGSSNDLDGNTNVYRCPFWKQSAIKLATRSNFSIQISDRPDLSHAQQIYAHMSMGAARTDEDLVCFVECQ